METLTAELLISAIAGLTLLLLPITSRLIGSVGGELSRELDGGRAGQDLVRYLSDRG